MNHLKKLKVGVLGCGPIAQFTHFEACQKAKNVELYCICDAAEDLLHRMNVMWQPKKIYTNYRAMLEDAQLEAVIIATADTFHVPLAMMAVEAGKHVLVEKPLSHSIEECLLLEEAAKKHNVLVQVGHMKRFDAGIAYAQQFITEKIGDLLALKVWYGDHTHRYTETDNLQPIPVKSQLALKPNHNEKADLKRYYMMAHGSHLLDTAQFLGGPISSLRARLIQKFDAYCWFIDVGFQNGALGHLDLTIKLRGDWHEGFQVYGEHGSVFAKTYNPWYYKSSEVECFLESEQQFYRPLGADGFSYRIQLEHFAEVILHQIPHLGTTIQQGLAITKAMIAIQQSVATQQTIYLDDLKDGAL